MSGPHAHLVATECNWLRRILPALPPRFADLDRVSILIATQLTGKYGRFGVDSLGAARTHSPGLSLSTFQDYISLQLATNLHNAPGSPFTLDVPPTANKPISGSHDDRLVMVVRELGFPPSALLDPNAALAIEGFWDIAGNGRTGNFNSPYTASHTPENSPPVSSYPSSYDTLASPTPASSTLVPASNTFALALKSFAPASKRFASASNTLASASNTLATKTPALRTPLSTRSTTEFGGRADGTLSDATLTRKRKAADGTLSRVAIPPSNNSIQGTTSRSRPAEPAVGIDGGQTASTRAASDAIFEPLHLPSAKRTQLDAPASSSDTTMSTTSSGALPPGFCFVRKMEAKQATNEAQIPYELSRQGVSALSQAALEDGYNTVCDAWLSSFDVTQIPLGAKGVPSSI